MNLGVNVNKKVNLIKLVVIILLSILLIYSILLLPNLTDTNLVANPSFESGETHPLNWSFVSNDGNVPIWENTYYSDKKSIKINIPGVLDKESGYLKSDLIKAKSNQYYIFSSWGKTEGAGGINEPRVSVVEFDANMNLLYQNNIKFNKGTNDWKQKSIIFQTHTNTTYLSVYANIWKGYGTFWVDDISLIPRNWVLTSGLAPKSAPEPPVLADYTYYVDINGSDENPGTEAQPWKTIQKAADTAAAGDTVYVKNGTYNEQVWVKNSGSARKWIKFLAYPGDEVTIDGTGISMVINPNGDRWNGLFNIHGKSYINVSGFKFVNSEFAGFFVTKDYITEVPSSNIIFKNNYLERTWGAAIIMLGEASMPATNFIVDRNTLVQSHFSDDSKAMEGITIGHNVENFEIKNNFIKDSFHGVIDVKNGVSNGKIYRNTCTTSTYSCVYVDGWTGGASNIDVFENVVHDMKSQNADDVSSGFSVASEEGGYVENIKFYNNLVYNNPGVAMIIPWYSKGQIDNITIISNTFYNNGVGHEYRGGIILDYDRATGVVVRNNIVSLNNEFQIWSENSGAIIDHNLIDGYKGYYSFETRGTNYIEGNPQFVNPTNSDFHLKNTSPSIDKGSPSDAPDMDFDGNSRPSGGGYDIGAFEHKQLPMHGKNISELALQ